MELILLTSPYTVSLGLLIIALYNYDDDDWWGGY